MRVTLISPQYSFVDGDVWVLNRAAIASGAFPTSVEMVAIRDNIIENAPITVPGRTPES